MSYLEMYDNTKVVSPGEGAIPDSVHAETPPPVQAMFVRQNLTNELAQSILDALPEVQAINLSRNNLTIFPNIASSHLIALNISHNQIAIPIALTATFMLIELNLCNNKITDLRGLSMLTSVVYLDVSENLLSQVDGLENMKALKVLKVAFNKINNFQGLRLLTYNSTLHDIWLEGNPIEQDVYYKVKLLKYVPHLKTLDGTTVWRRTALQSTIVNDDLKYSDLCQRTPGTVDKYAKLSRRSASQLVNESILNNFSASMLTMQSLQLSTAGPLNSSTSRGQNSTSVGAPAQSQYQLRCLSDVTRTQDVSYVAQSSFTRPSSTGRTHRAHDADLSLLPPELRVALTKQNKAHHSGRGSPSPRRPSSAASPSRREKEKAAAGAAARKQEEVPSAQERSRSALPWRRPPSIAPNLESRSKARLRTSLEQVPGVYKQRGQASVSVAAPNRTAGSGGVKPAERKDRLEAAPPVAPMGRVPVSQPQSTKQNAPVATPARSASPLRITTAPSPHPERRRSPSPTTSPTAADRWMMPELNQEDTRRAPGDLLNMPPPQRFDSDMMELTNHSSMQILQKSFDADRRGVSTRGRSRSRDAGTPRSSRGSGSVTSSASPSRRSVSQTRSSVARMSFTTDMLRAQEQEERTAKILVEQRTFCRPTSPSPYPRSPAYSIRQGTMQSSPSNSENNSTVMKLTSSRLDRAFSPTNRSQAASRANRSIASVNCTSPSRLNSVERILQHYDSQHGASRMNNSEPNLVLPSAANKTNAPRPENARQTSSRLYSEESKNISPVESVDEMAPSARSTVPVPTVAPVPASDESPYRRFLKLRERLSDKYMNGTEERVDAQQQRYASEEGHHGAPAHMYDYVRDMNVDKVERIFNPALGSPDARDLGEIESKIVELQEQDLQFHQLKEQFQRQFQEQYEKQKQDLDAKFATSKTSTPAPPPPPLAVGAASTAKGGGGSVVASTPMPGLPPPPPTGGYDVLYDLIQRRRTVLEHIASPSDISPEKSRVPTNGAGSSQGIFNAISDLKQRQSASVNVIQSMTRERQLPSGPVRDSMAQVALGTPALHPSINNYLTMANSPPPSHAIPAGVIPAAGNGFMARLTSNNPYMQPSNVAVPQPVPSTAGWVQGRIPFDLSTAAMSPAPPAPAPAPAVPYYQPMPYAPVGRPPPVPERSVSPKNRNRSAVPRTISPTNHARSPRTSSPTNGKRGATGASLSSMIHSLQAKQTKDLQRLNSF